MAKDYTIKDIKVGSAGTHGNTWCTVTFAEHGEPVAWLTKEPNTLKVGDKVYGDIKEEAKKSGGTYLRFRKEIKVESGQEPVDWDKKDAYIRYQWAYRESLAHFDRTKDNTLIGEVRDMAKALVRMVDEDVQEYLK